MGLENLFIDTSDTTVSFPNCPDVATEFFQPQCTSTRKPPDKRISDLVQRHIDSYEEHLSKAHGGVTIFGQEKQPPLDNGRKRPAGSEASSAPAAKLMAIQGDRTGDSNSEWQDETVQV